MKITTLLMAIPVLCLTSCFKGDNAPTTDSGNDASGTGAPYLAREVVGVHMLTTDADYDEPCTILGEELVRSTFKLGATTEVAELKYPNGCVFEWGGSKISLAFGGRRPYPSTYHAEYIFDKKYQPGAASVAEDTEGESMHEKAPLSGPQTEGTAAEHPATESEGKQSTNVNADASAKNDTSNSVSHVTSAAIHLTKPAVSTGRFVAVPEVGDKAVWEPTSGAMHVLYNNHIINVTVATKDNPEIRKEHAKALAEVMIDKIAHNEYTR